MQPINIFIKLFVFLFFVIVSSCANAVDIKFNTYIVGQIYNESAHKLKYTDHSMSESAWNEYKNIKKVNFAGFFNLFTFDCGTTAICGEILNVKTGEIVAELPDQYLSEDINDENYQLDIDFRKDSRLIIISGRSANITMDKNGNVVKSRNKVSYFEFKDNKFNLIKESLK